MPAPNFYSQCENADEDHKSNLQKQSQNKQVAETDDEQGAMNQSGDRGRRQKTEQEKGDNGQKQHLLPMGDHQGRFSFCNKTGTERKAKRKQKRRKEEQSGASTDNCRKLQNLNSIRTTMNSQDSIRTKTGTTRHNLNRTNYLANHKT